MADACSNVVGTASAVKNAQDALRRFRRENYALDPSERSHIEAYLLARRDSQRPRAEDVLKILSSKKDTHEKGCRISSRFHMVSASLLPKRLPANLAEY